MHTLFMLSRLVFNPAIVVWINFATLEPFLGILVAGKLSLLQSSVILGVECITFVFCLLFLHQISKFKIVNNIKANTRRLHESF